MPDTANAVATGTTSWGCPIGIYKQKATSPKLHVWNKITIYFQVPAFPTSMAKYKVYVNIGGATNNPLVAFPSIASNMASYPSGSKLVWTKSAAILSCANVGQLSAGTYWIAASIAYVNAIAASELATLGAIKFS